MSDKKTDSAKPGPKKPAQPAADAPEETAPGDQQAAAGGEGADEPSAWSAGEAADVAALVEALQAESAEFKDRMLRAHAEMENLRRRTEREKAETAKYAISAFARDVLSVGDNIARAIEAVPQEEVAGDAALKALLEGVQMTERELVNSLERHGIARHDPKGERFDPNRHQAMFEVDNKDVPEGTIVEVMQAGYVIEDRILRPAMVGIAKGGEKLPKPEPEVPPVAANDDDPGAGPEDDDGGSDGPPGGTLDKSA